MKDLWSTLTTSVRKDFISFYCLFLFFSFFFFAFYYFFSYCMNITEKTLCHVEQDGVEEMIISVSNTLGNP